MYQFQYDVNLSPGGKGVTRLLTINDMLVDCSIKDAAAQAKSTKSELHFGQYTCANGWFFKKNFLGLYSGSLKATDICWVYPRKVRHGIVPVIGIIPIPIPLGSTFDIACRRSNGRMIILNNGECIKSGVKIPTTTADTFHQLQSLIPWVIFGYSPIWRNAGKSMGEYF